MECTTGGYQYIKNAGYITIVLQQEGIARNMTQHDAAASRENSVIRQMHANA
jgi:hypothetical protein